MSLAHPFTPPGVKSSADSVHQLEVWGRRLGPAFGLAAAVGLLVALRWFVLREFAYPPGSDAGGDLYGAHFWTGHPLPGASGFPALPPVYSLVVVAPSVTWLPVFAGIQLYLTLVPALIAVPAYLLFRQSPMAPLAAGVGAVLLAGSAAFSLMLTWNAAYNLFGILLLTGFLAALVAALRTGGRGPVLLAALLFGATAGSHELSFVVAVIVLTVALGVYALGADGPWRTRLRRPALLGGLCAAAAAPFAGLYLVFARQGANSGIGTYGANLPVVYGNALFFPWGSQTGAIPPLVLVDVGVVAAGILLWAYRPRTDAVYLSVIGGAILAALLVPVLDASEAVRGLYFLPVPLSGAAANVVDFLFQRPSPGAAPVRGASTGPPALRALRRGLAGFPRRGSLPFAAIALGAFLLGANLPYSLNVQAQGDRFYQSLDAPRVAALDWIRTQTPATTVVYDGAGLSAWIWGYGQRVAYSPQPLWAQNTAASYAAALAADRLDMGAYLVGNGGVVVGSNLPGTAGTPTVYVATPGSWVPLFTSQAGDLAFHVRDASGLRSLSLATAQVVWVGPLPPSVDRATLQTDLWWPSVRLGVTETISVTNGSLEFWWSSNDSSFVSTSWRLSLPPAGYFLDYAFTPAGTPSGWSASFAPPAGPAFGLAAAGGSFQWHLNASQWATVDFAGASLFVNLTGLPFSAGPAFTLDTSTLFRTLGITYALVDYDRDYGMYTRLESGGPGHLTAVQRAQFGSVYIFSVGVP